MIISEIHLLNIPENGFTALVVNITVKNYKVMLHEIRNFNKLKPRLIKQLS